MRSSWRPLEPCSLWSLPLCPSSGHWWEWHHRQGNGRECFLAFSFTGAALQVHDSIFVYLSLHVFFTGCKSCLFAIVFLFVYCHCLFIVVYHCQCCLLLSLFVVIFVYCCHCCLLLSLLVFLVIVVCCCLLLSLLFIVVIVSQGLLLRSLQQSLSLLPLRTSSLPLLHAILVQRFRPHSARDSRRCKSTFVPNFESSRTALAKALLCLLDGDGTTEVNIVS